MKILFALDGSPRALAALDVLLARLDWFAKPVSLDLVYVHPELPYPAATSWIGKDNVQKYYDDESKQVLEPAVAKATAKNVKANTVQLVGDAASEIVRQAATGYDMVVMSARGQTALANLVIGSVTTKVIATSTVPVLLLH